MNDIVTIVFIDFTNAFDTIGHLHIGETLKRLPLPNNLGYLIMHLQRENSTNIETNGHCSSKINLNCGVMQGVPISSALCNLASRDSISFKYVCVCVCANANPLHYYALWVPPKADRWH